MAFYGDYHTHTPYSHGTGTIKENAVAGLNKGLKEIAITDHGLTHIMYGIRKKQLQSFIDEVDFVNSENLGIKILKGIEANIDTLDGKLIMTQSEIDSLDIINAGYHFATRPPDLKNLTKFFAPNYIASVTKHWSKRLIETNTNATIKLLENNPIDILTHPSYAARIDVARVAKVAKQTDTMIELNGKRINFTDADMEALLTEDVMFIINSDAHKAEHVARFDYPYSFSLKYKIPEDKIANLNKLPTFKRFKR